MPDIDEDVMRELMFRSTADLHARPAATAPRLSGTGSASCGPACSASPGSPPRPGWPPGSS